MFDVFDILDIGWTTLALLLRIPLVLGSRALALHDGVWYVCCTNAKYVQYVPMLL